MCSKRKLYGIDDLILIDSGDRTSFDSGAVRDIQKGKGRCDLLPLFDIGKYEKDDVLSLIGIYRETGNVIALFNAIQECNKKAGDTEYSSLLKLAKHYEKGAKKYSERNWEKGIPVHCFIDSGVRHYLKWTCGWTDEPHKDAFLWNIWGAIWTIRNHPELDDFYIHSADFTAKKILADLANGTVNDTTNSLTTKIIFGNERNPQEEFNYRDMGDDNVDKDK